MSIGVCSVSAAASDVGSVGSSSEVGRTGDSTDAADAEISKLSAINVGASGISISFTSCGGCISAGVEVGKTLNRAVRADGSTELAGSSVNPCAQTLSKRCKAASGISVTGDVAGSSAAIEVNLTTNGANATDVGVVAELGTLESGGFSGG